MSRAQRHVRSWGRTAVAAGLLLLCPSFALAQTNPEKAPEKTNPAPASPAVPSPAAPSPAAPAAAPSPSATAPTKDTPAPAPSPSATDSSATDSSAAPGGAGEAPPQVSPPVTPAASEPPPAGEPAAPATPPAAPAPSTIPAPEAATQESVDDYEGATDAALVEEKSGPKNLSLGVAVDLTWPVGKTSDFISKASIQGLSLDLRYYAWGNIGIGAGLALDSLSKKSTEKVTWENATITGTQVRELSYTPLTLKGYYAWRDQERIIPYVAAGLGAARAVKRLTVGVSSLSEASWHFAIVPEAGVQIPAGPTLLLANFRLNYLPPSAGVGEHMFANFSFGLSIQ